MSLTIPLRQDSPHFGLAVVLDDVTYGLELQWITREQSWYLDVLTEEGDPIFVGVKVLPRVFLGARCRDPRKPPGVFTIYDTSGRDAPPGLADLGARVQLLYFTADEATQA